MICPKCGGDGRFNRGTPSESTCGRCGGAGVVPDPRGQGQERRGGRSCSVVIVPVVVLILVAVLLL